MDEGTLYILASPIGNLSDLSPRAQAVLGEVHLVAAEDTRRTLKLLNHLGLRKPLLRCDERSQLRAFPRILDELRSGHSVALVSDAGVPTLADPGASLVGLVSQENLTVVPIPGPSAVTAALSVCGFPVVPYGFFGFLPRKGKIRREILEHVQQGYMAVVLFESPYRLQKTLKSLAETFPDRFCCVAREMTKLHEEIVRGPLPEVEAHFLNKNIRGECTIVIARQEKP